MEEAKAPPAPSTQAVEEKKQGKIIDLVFLALGSLFEAMRQVNLSLGCHIWFEINVELSTSAERDQNVLFSQVHKWYLGQIWLWKSFGSNTSPFFNMKMLLWCQKSVSSYINNWAMSIKTGFVYFVKVSAFELYISGENGAKVQICALFFSLAPVYPSLRSHENHMFCWR